MASDIRPGCPYSIVAIRPQRYNELYAQINISNDSSPGAMRGRWKTCLSKVTAIWRLSISAATSA